MAEYIEREAVLESIAKKHGTRNDVEEKTALDIWDDIKKIPTADIVPVVRCKDCKYYDVYRLECHNPYHNGIINCEGYCSYGERRCDDVL